MATPTPAPGVDTYQRFGSWVTLIEAAYADQRALDRLAQQVTNDTVLPYGRRLILLGRVDRYRDTLRAQTLASAREEIMSGIPDPTLGDVDDREDPPA